MHVRVELQRPGDDARQVTMRSSKEEECSSPHKSCLLATTRCLKSFSLSLSLSVFRFASVTLTGDRGRTTQCKFGTDVCVRCFMVPLSHGPHGDELSSSFDTTYSSFFALRILSE